MEPRSSSIFTDIRCFGHQASKIADNICKDHVQLANTQEQLIFNIRCKKYKVIPKSLRMKPPIRTPEGFRISKHTSLQYLKAYISNCHYRIGCYLRRIVNNTQTLENLIPPDLLNRLKLEATRKHTKVRALKKQQLINKFEFLSRKTTVRDSNPNWVVNLSDRELSCDEHNVLAKGLSFATTHNEKDKLHFVASIEPFVNDIDGISNEDKNIIRQKIATAVQSAPRDHNITRAESIAINSIKSDPSVVVVPADKGKSAVVMNTTDYNAKISSHLNDTSTYTKLNSNPTKTLQNKVNNELKRLKDIAALSDEEYKILRS